MIAMIIQAVATLPDHPPNLPPKTPEARPAQDAASQVQSGSLFPDNNLVLTLIILFFGLLALWVLYLMVKKDRREEFELRIFTITILVFGSLLIVAAGYGKDTLAPVIGFFGTIAGYILGRGEALDESNKNRRLEGPNKTLLLDDRRNENS